MGMVVMSKRELNRLDVLARLDSDKLTARAAAELMAITLRQTYRLLRRYRDGGASAVANQRRGRPSNNRLPDVVRDHAIALVRERYADFGPTFAAEKLAERHDLANISAGSGTSLVRALTMPSGMSGSLPFSIAV
jgi:hypothetical protein